MAESRAQENKAENKAEEEKREALRAWFAKQAGPALSGLDVWTNQHRDLSDQERAAKESQSLGQMSNQMNKKSVGDGVYEVSTKFKRNPKDQIPVEFKFSMEQKNGNLTCLHEPKTPEEFKAMMAAVIRGYATRFGQKDLVLEFPNCSSAKDIPLDKVLATLQAASELPSGVTVTIELDPKIHQKLSMAGAKIAEKEASGQKLTKEEQMVKDIQSLQKQLVTKQDENKELQGEVKRLEAEKQEKEVKTNAGLNIQQLENNIKALDAAKAQVDKIHADPNAKPEDKQKEMDALKKSVEEIKATVSNVEKEIDKKLPNDILEKYKKAVESADTALKKIDQGTLDKDTTKALGTTHKEVTASVAETNRNVDALAAPSEEKPKKYEGLVQEKLDTLSKAIEELEKLDAGADKAKVLEKMGDVEKAVSGVNKILTRVERGINADNNDKDTLEAYQKVMKDAQAGVSGQASKLEEVSKKLDIPNKSPEEKDQLKYTTEVCKNLDDRLTKLGQHTEELSAKSAAPSRQP